MDSQTSVIRNEVFVATTCPGEHRLWKHMPRISPCDGVVTGPLPGPNLDCNGVGTSWWGLR